MGQRRRSHVAPGLGAKRAQGVSAAPGDISKKAMIQGLLSGKSFALSEMVAADLQTPHTFATLLDGWDTGVAGLAPAASTYVFNLSGVGFTAAAKFAPNTIIYVSLTKGGNTYVMTVDAAGTFTAAASAGSITINAGACSITRATGALTLVTAAATDDLSGAKWSMTAFVIEGVRSVTGVAPHGGGWGLARLSQREGVVEIPNVNASGGALTAPESSIYLQSLPEHSGGSFANNKLQCTFLISPFMQMKDDTRMWFHAGADPKLVLDPADGGWTELFWDDLGDLAGDTLLYNTKVDTVGGGSVKIITLRLDFHHTDRHEPTFFYGFGIGIN
jgi:hypothetical protein